MPILNLENSTPKLLESLKASSFDFYLTGSRFWGNYSCDSDWDFFVTDCTNVRVFLSNLGFNSLSKNNGYTDFSCIDVFEKDNIQIQLVINGEEKQKVQELLFELYPFGFSSKLIAKQFWNVAMKAYYLS